ncbi:MAG TPA: hypothetical protein VD927_07690 [Chryseosolibacter sp.]|nr:hypothetical protein [Chryseosolibacter sp.]
MKAVFSIILLVVCLQQGFSQAKTRRFPNSINHPSLNVFAPFISANGNAIVFLSDNAEDGALTPFYSFKEAGDWKQPVVLPKNLHTRLNFLKGYALSADGKKMSITSIKGPGVGGYDLWTSEWKNNAWSEPANFGLPVNTRLHEAAPSFSVDGNTMLFMRCEQMDQMVAGKCSIWMSTRKSGGSWNEPEMLPASINTGNSQTPRMLADGETLIFSSDKMPGGKGGMDLYVSKKRGDNWSAPIAMEFVNTAGDDQYVSVEASGRYLLKDAPGRKNEIIEYLIPDELRPAALVKVEGTVTFDGSTPTSSYVSVYDFSQQKSVYNAPAMGGDGKFLLYLKEGSRYELAVDPADDKYTFFSKKYDLTESLPGPDRITAKIQPLQEGAEIIVDGILFHPFTSEVDLDMSSNEVRRLTRLINANADFTFELQVLLSGYVEDANKVNEDLTEISVDTVTTQTVSLDSLGNEIMQDSVEVKVTYHNDRTAKQGEEIINLLEAHGVDRNRLKLITNAREAIFPEEKKLTIKLVAAK